MAKKKAENNSSGIVKSFIGQAVKLDTLDTHAHTRKKLTEKQIIEAIAGTGGIASEVARKLGVARSTVYNYRAQYPAVAEALDEAVNETLDIAESRLADAIKGGDIEAIKFYLRTKGKSRGYTEKVESELSGTVAIAPAPIVRFEAPPEIPANPDN